MRLLLINLLIILLFISCKTSNDVINGRKIQKRKYTSGWYVQGLEKGKTRKDTSSSASLASAHIEPNKIQKTEIQEFSIEDSTENHLALNENDTNESAQSFVEKKRFNPLVEKLGAFAIPVLNTGQLSQADYHDVFGAKRRGKKEKLEPLTLWGWNCVALSSWLVGWPIHFPIVAIPLALIGIIMMIASLSKLRKNKKRNKRICIIGIAFGIILIITAIVI